jgi:predicted nucleic acid-binding protein
VKIATDETDAAQMYLDTAVFLKLLVREPDSAHYVRIVQGQIVWSSQIIVTETYSALLRKEREGAITAAHRKRAWKQVEADVAASRLNLTPLSSAILESANAILEACHPLVALRSLDAIHLASARESRSWPLCTNDVRMREAATRLALPLTPLPR